MMQLRRIGLVMGLLLLTSPSALAQDDEGPARFAGTWSYNGTAAHGAAVINEAVGETVAPMNIFVRAIAAGRLRGKNPLVQRIQITVTGQQVRVVFDGSRTYTTNLDEWRAHTVDGEAVRVQFRYRDGTLVQLFRTSGGTRRNVYRMTSDSRMTLSVTVQSDQLPRDMNYRLTYRR